MKGDEDLPTLQKTVNWEANEAFVMKHVEDRSYEEMAGLLGVGAEALKMRVHRARDALKVRLGGRV